MTREEFISIINYNPEWFTFNFLPKTFLDEQIKLYLKGDDLDIEHYKWAAYSYILAHEDFGNIDRLKEFMQVINHDPNEHLYKGAVSALISNRILIKEILPSLGYVRFENNAKIMAKLGK